MTQSSELLALAERCEAATGPDRELDKQINATVGGFAYHHLETASYCNPPSPAYTASIDAALTLVPEGLEFAIGSGRRKSLSMQRPWGSIFAPDEIGSVCIRAATPALALCAVAFRTLATKDERHEG